MDGAIRAFKRQSFDPNGIFDVRFSDCDRSEGAVDAGGPTREFFRLLIKHIIGSAIFLQLLFTNNVNQSNVLYITMYTN